MKNEFDQFACPFCDQELMWVDNETKNVDFCCFQQDIINNNGMNVCKNCGSVHYFDNVNNFIDFYENMYKIKRKSVYHRKYHIENVINELNIQITRNQMDKIFKVFVETDKILPLINNGQKRMISINYVLKQLFEMMKLSHDTIKIPK